MTKPNEPSCGSLTPDEVQTDPELARAMDLWPALPEALRRGLTGWPELPEGIQTGILALFGAAVK